MKTPNTSRKNKKSKKNMDLKKEKVLFQKLGNQWYAFSVVNGEVYYTSVQLSQSIKNHFAA